MSDGIIHIECQEKGGLRRVYSVCVAATATVQNVREALAPLCKARLPGILLYDGEEYLMNHIRLDQYEIKDGAHLLFEARMCGVLPADHDWSKSGIKTKPPRFAF